VAKINIVGVIGGGVSGLSAGGLLARKGMRVKVFEARDKLGGCCANTIIGGYTFNDGAGYLCFPRVLDHVFEKLDLDRRSILPLRKAETQKTTLSDSTVVTLGGKDRVTVRRKTGEVGAVRLQEELKAALKKWEPVLHILEDDIFTHPVPPSPLTPKLWPHIHKFQGTVESEIKGLFSDKAVRAALAGALMYTGLPPRKMPVLLILGLISILSKGSYLPEGGMGKIPEALARCLENDGGEILLDSKVKRILLKNGVVRGLEIEGQGPVEVDAVISTASGMATYTSLLNAEELPKRMLRKVQRAPLSHKALSIQLGLSNVIEGCSHSNSILPMMEEQSKLFALKGDEVKWLVYFVPTVTMPHLAPPGGSIVEMFPAIRQDIPADDWDEQITERVVDSALRALSHLHKIDIAVKRVRSPKHFQFHMHLYHGAIYGLSASQDFKTKFPHDSGLPGLYQAGQTSHPGFGIEPAAMSGIFAAEALLGAKGI